MSNTVRNIALQTIIPVLFGFIALNAYLCSKNLNDIHNNIARYRAASELQADISTVLHDLQDMETAQRGYLLTGDASYLQPYQDADGTLPSALAKLRSRLLGRDRLLEMRLEEIAESKTAEIRQTIRLREQGYRHRAFLLVGSNRGKELMDEARSILSALSSVQAGNAARYDREAGESVGRAVKESLLASFILLAVTVVIFLALNAYRRRLEIACARREQELQATSAQLKHITSTMFQDFRALVEQTGDCASALLQVHGGFLPRQGQEKAERIQDGAGRMIWLLDNLSRNPVSESSIEIGDLHRLSA